MLSNASSSTAYGLRIQLLSICFKHWMVTLLHINQIRFSESLLEFYERSFRMLACEINNIFVRNGQFFSLVKVILTLFLWLTVRGKKKYITVSRSRSRHVKSQASSSFSPTCGDCRALCSSCRNSHGCIWRWNGANLETVMITDKGTWEMFSVLIVCSSQPFVWFLR